MKLIIEGIIADTNFTTDAEAQFAVVNGTSVLVNTNVGISLSGVSTVAGYKSAIVNGVLAWVNANGYPSLTSADVIYGFSFESPSTPTQSQVTRSIVTGTGATGFQLSTTQSAEVNYNITIATSATLAASASGTIVLEIASTNSATASDWKEVGRLTNGQAFSLAVAIGCTQTIAGQIGGFVPSGYYVKIRSINNSGTPTYTYNSGQEVLL